MRLSESGRLFPRLLFLGLVALLLLCEVKRSEAQVGGVGGIPGAIRPTSTFMCFSKNP